MLFGHVLTIFYAYQLGKITREEMEKELVSLGVSIKAVNGIIEVLSLKSLSKLEGLAQLSFYNILFLSFC